MKGPGTTVMVARTRTMTASGSTIGRAYSARLRAMVLLICVDEYLNTVK